MDGRTTSHEARSNRIWMGRHDALRDRARGVRASHAGPSSQAPEGREDDGDESRQ
jgi:hypothetical protein